MNNNFYITTTLPYVNGKPHIGHTLEFIQADTIARYKRMKGFNVYFNTGTDEHGLKIFQKAIESNVDVQDYVNENANYWIDEFCTKFDISYSRFIRTTDEDHIKAAQQFWNASLENGDIYKKHYEGLYCVGCEEFKTEKDLVDGKCPDHGKEPIVHSEENYFFKFSKYQNQLLELYKQNPEFVKPESKLKEMINFVSSGLEDFSISRKKENLPWGIPVPGDESQVMYVWFDALVNYITTIGYGSNDAEFKKWWPVTQLCGPDNTRFQSAMWQAMLMSVGIQPSKQILVHGTVLGEDGTKMSKTKGNVVSPMDLYNKYGLEAIRYYLISGIPTLSDSAFNYNELEAKYKSDLQNNFGNLLNRVITLVNKKEITYKEDRLTSDFKNNVDKFVAIYEGKMNEYDLYEAAKAIVELGNFGNLYVTEREPWKKDNSQTHVEETLNNLVYLCKKLIYCYQPIIPGATEKAKKALDNFENIILFPNIV